MEFQNKFNFCIIPSPYSQGLKCLVFIAPYGANQIDEKLASSEEYEKIANQMSGLGFKEFDICVFESIESLNITREELAIKIANFGFIYSKPFEFNVVSELESFKTELYTFTNFDLLPDNSISFSTTKAIDEYQVKSHVPQIGEKIKLNFYLFLKCIFLNENDCTIELIGDLYSRENSNTRNFLQIVQSDFVRLESPIPNVILLQSTKSFKDFVSEINFLYRGNFKFGRPILNPDGQMTMKTKEYVYNIMEIKKHVNSSHKITVEVNLNKFYDDMINMSKKIKREQTTEFKKNISLEALKPDIIELKCKLQDKMLNYADSDEFEKANTVKRDINFIQKKIEIIENLDKKIITQKEYFKNFCLNS